MCLTVRQESKVQRGRWQVKAVMMFWDACIVAVRSRETLLVRCLRVSQTRHLLFLLDCSKCFSPESEFTAALMQASKASHAQGPFGTFCHLFVQDVPKHKDKWLRISSISFVRFAFEHLVTQDATKKCDLHLLCLSWAAPQAVDGQIP